MEEDWGSSRKEIVHLDFLLRILTFLYSVPPSKLKKCISFSASVILVVIPGGF